LIQISVQEQGANFVGAQQMPDPVERADRQQW